MPIAETKFITVPAGRFLIDIPGEATLSWGRQGYEYAGPFIEVFPAAEPGLVLELMEARAKALEIPHSKGGNQLLKKQIGKIKFSWFIFYWKNEFFKGRFLKVNGYFWRDGQGFIFQTGCRADPADMDLAIEVMEREFNKVKIRDSREIPEVPGFCIENAIFQGKPAGQPKENLAMHIHLPTHPDVFLCFRTDTVSEQVANGTKLLDRGTKDPFVIRLVTGIRRLRGQERRVGPYEGQEFVERVREPNFGVGYSFMWEYPGVGESATSPSLHLEMMTGHGEPPVNSSLNRKDAMALWDKVLDSIRYREPREPS